MFDTTTRRHLAQLFFIAIVALFLAGCASDNGGPGGPGAGMGGGSGASGTQARNTPNQAVPRGLKGIPKNDRAMFNDPNNPLSTRVILFPFNSSTISDKYANVVQAHARYLSKHPNVHLRLEGHTDKRGTREYNIALGSRRAKSVANALQLSGASASQLSTLSFGEERPAVMGDSQSEMAKNRRVVLIYVKQGSGDGM